MTINSLTINLLIITPFFTDGLLSVAKSVPALSLTELLSMQNGVFTVTGVPT